nr:uncharacterized protein LOC108071707 isoform X3 [Drosophila kikkawai]
MSCNRGHKIDWKPEHVTHLLQLLKQHPNIYDQGHIFYLDKKARDESMAKILTPLQAKLPNLTVEDIKVKYGALRSHYVLLSRQIASETGAGKHMKVPYWYNHMDFLRTHLNGAGHRNGDESTDQSVGKRLRLDKNLMALDSILGARENNAELPLSEGSSEDDELSHLSYPPHRRKCAPKSKEERSPYEAILHIAIDAAERLASRQNYSPDVEAFGELIKAELESLQDLDQRKKLRNKLMQLSSGTPCCS